MSTILEYSVCLKWTKKNWKNLIVIVCKRCILNLRVISKWLVNAHLIWLTCSHQYQFFFRTIPFPLKYIYDANAIEWNPYCICIPLFNHTVDPYYRDSFDTNEIFPISFHVAINVRSFVRNCWFVFSFTLIQKSHIWWNNTEIWGDFLDTLKKSLFSDWIRRFQDIGLTDFISPSSHCFDPFISLIFGL